MDITQAQSALQKFRSQYQGYDDLDDATLASKLAAKHPEYADLAGAFANPTSSHDNDWKPLSRGTEGSVPLDQAVVTARRQAQGEIDDREQGRTYKLISPEIGYDYVYDPKGGTPMSPEEKKAVLKAHLMKTAGIDNGYFGADTTDVNGARNANARLKAQAAKDNNAAQNFTGAMGESMANFGLGIEGLVAPEAAAKQRANVQDVYNPDPDAKASVAGRVAGSTVAMLPAVMAGPGAGALVNAYSTVLPYTFAAQGAGEARIDAYNRRQAGQDISGGQEAANAILQGGLNYAGSKISLGGMTNNIANPALRLGYGGLIGAADNTGIAVGSGLISAATMNDSNALHAPTIEDMIGGAAGGATGAAFHTPTAREHAPAARAESAPVEKTAQAPDAAHSALHDALPASPDDHAAMAAALETHDPTWRELRRQHEEAADGPAKDALELKLEDHLDGVIERHFEDGPAVAAKPKAEETPAAKAEEPATRVYADESPASNKPKEVPNEIANAGKGKIREWAEANGFDTSRLEGMGKRPMLTELRRQSEQAQFPAFEKGRAAVRDEVLPEMPKGSESWDAGRLKKWAKENGYEIDEGRIIDKSDRRPDEKHADQVRRQIREQRGEGGDLIQRHERTTESDRPAADEAAPTKSTDKLTADVDKALAEGDARLAAETAAQGVKPAKAAAPPPREGTLPKVPRGARAWSFTKLKTWAKDNGYKIGTKQNLNSLRRAITAQRSNSTIDLPLPPKAASKWNNRRFKYWADKNGYDVSAATNRYEVKQAIVAQRKAAKAAARGETVQAPTKAAAGAAAEPTTRTPADAATPAPVAGKRRTADRETPESRKIAALEADVQKYKKEARENPLTGGQNRRAFEDIGQAVQKRADETGKPASLISFDAANLKAVNDKLGETAGDAFLKEVMDAIHKVVRPEDSFHYGGDEYAVMLPDTNAKQAALIRDRIEAEVGKKEIVPGVSKFLVGDVAEYKPGSRESLRDLTTRASVGMKTRKTEMKKAAGEATTREGAEAKLAAAKDSVAAAAPTVAKVKRAAAVAVASPETGPAIKEVMGKPKGWVPKAIEEFITPISSRIRDISGTLYNRLMKMEFDTGVMRERIKRDLHDPAGNLIAALGGKSGEKYQDFRLAVANQDFAAAKALLPDAQHANFQKFIDAYAELHTHMKDNGVSIGKLDDYWPRFHKDHDAFDAIYGDGKGKFEDAWELAQRQRGGKPLSKEEKMEIANDVSQGYGPIKPGSQGIPNSRERSIDKITREQLKHYVDPFESAFRYVDGAAYAGERAKFLGRSDDLSKLPESVGKIIEEHVKDGTLDKARQQEALDLMHSRFTADFLTPSRGTRRVKELMYLTSLGNFRSAISQLTDVAVTAATYGLKNTFKGVRSMFSKSDKRIVMEAMGLHEHGAEFKDVTRTGKILDRALTLTGFKMIDRMGKENHANAAVHYFTEAVNNPTGEKMRRFERDYRPVLGDVDFAKTVADLKAGEKTENTRYLAFLELTKVQPVTLSQMPERYLKMKDGRIFYALKTFTVTALDNLRRTTFTKLATPGQRREGLTNLASYIALVGAAAIGKDLLQDFMKGKKPTADSIPDRSVAALLTMVGLNRYAVDKTVKKPSEGIATFLMPPMSWVDATTNDVRTMGKDTKGNWQGIKTVQQLPVVGDLLYYWTPIGQGGKLTADAAKKDYNDKLNELRKQAATEVASNDDADAQALLSIYNERVKNAPAGVVKNKPVETVGTVRARMFRATQKAALAAATEKK